MKQLSKIFLIAAFSLLSVFNSGAREKVSVNASLDSVNLLMGNRTAIHLKIVEPENATGILLLQPETELTGNIEISAITEGDTTSLGSGMREIVREIIIQSFDSGDYVIPEVKYLAGTDTFKSNQLAIRVTPVDVSEMETINPQADIEPGSSRWFDFLPDFLIDYWAWILICLFATVAGIVLYILLHKKKLPAIMRKEAPKPSPYEVAITELNNLKSQDLCAVGREKEYYTRLTDILRVYLQDRFGINAMEMTTGQITRAVNANSETRPSESAMRTILEMADFVKFAKARPLPEDNVRTFNNALKFVEDTKPQPVVDVASGVNNSKGASKEQ